MKIVNGNNCETIEKFDEEKHICAELIEGKRLTNDDVGSALIIGKPSIENPTIVGILSELPEEESTATLHVIYTRVSSSAMWIKEKANI